MAYGAVHSNGAMLIRGSVVKVSATPGQIRFDFVEPVRERSFHSPMLLNRRPLANLAVTVQTNRPQNIRGIHEHSLLLMGSYFRYFSCDNHMVEALWEDVRKSPVKATNKLLYAGLLDTACKPLLKKANWYDWLFFILYNIRYPIIFFRCLRCKIDFSETWTFLIHHT
jgi:hypothetical protein